jgi:hypothetical protein
LYNFLPPSIMNECGAQKSWLNPWDFIFLNCLKK